MKKQVGPNTWIGYDEAGQNLPVVLLHAFPLCREMWWPQLRALEDRFRVIAPDLRGFGETTGFLDAPSIDQMAEDVATLLDALRITEPVVLGGLSMGGYVALAFARRFAARLRALVLADTRAEADTPEGRANRDRLIALAESQGVGAVLEQLLPKLVGTQTQAERPGVVTELRRLAAAQTAQGVANALRAMRDRPDATIGLAAIDVPTLVLVGSEDQFATVDVARKMTGQIRGARMIALDGAGHLANLEQPEAFNRTLREFLQGLAVAAT